MFGVGLGSALLTGCMTTNEVMRTAPNSSGATLVNSSLYIYSFLDLSAPYLGADMLAELDKQLVDSFTRLTVKTRMVRFMESRTAQRTRARSISNGAYEMPVGPLITENITAERADRVEYRLIVLPKRFTVYGYNQHWEIDWQVTDAADNRMLWSTRTKGDRVVMWSNNEAAANRAKLMVDALIGEMRASGLFRGLPTT